MPLILILMLALFQGVITNYLILNPDYYQLGAYTWESSVFREMKLGDGLLKCEDGAGSTGGSRNAGKAGKAPVLNFDQITTLMIEHDYDMEKVKSYHYKDSLLPSVRSADYRKLKKAYETVLGDLTYFPIPANIKGNAPNVTFSEGWLDGRAYRSGGEEKTEDEGKKAARSHEGCDIMGAGKPRGYYPVVSMSDGIVERVGWLEMGGWRIGIRAPKGAYLYYAHLYGYARDFKEGETVKAGELLGYMGDSGYGKTEGTVGNFDVHLHVGIYIKTDHYEEMSVNPYWILRFLEERRLAFSY